MFVALSGLPIVVTFFIVLRACRRRGRTSGQAAVISSHGGSLGQH